MKKIPKKLHFLLIFVLILTQAPFGGLFSVFATEEAGVIASGTCGGDATWALTEDTVADWDLGPGKTPYKLTITGSGDMSWTGANSPWYAYRETVTSVSIADGITSIHDKAFYQFASLKTIALPDSVVSIGGQAFFWNSLLEEVNFGSSLETIGDGAFSQCTSLVSVTLPDSVTSIGKNGFGGDTKLTTFVCGAGLKTIGDAAFSGATRLESVTFNQFLERIGDQAFVNCAALESVTIPESVTYLGFNAFMSTGLTSFTIPKNVTSVGYAVLGQCGKLTEIIADGNANYQVIDHILYEMRNGTPYRAIAYPAALASDSAVVIAEGTEILDRYAFSNASKVPAFTLPSTLREIEAYCFLRCKLMEIHIPDSVEQVTSYAFMSTGLETVTVGKGLKEWEHNAWYNQSLANITISEENPYLASWDNLVFNKEKTRLLCYPSAKSDAVYHIPDTVESIAAYAITYVPSLVELYLPKSLKSLYYNLAIQSNANLKSIYFLGDAPTAGASSIKNNSKNLILYRTRVSTGWDVAAWTSFTFADYIPEGTVMADGTCGDLTWNYEGDIGRLTITGAGEVPDFTEQEPAPWSEFFIQTIEAAEVTALGDYSFVNKDALLRMEAGAALERIGAHTFAGCEKLRFVEISEAKRIGPAAFLNNRSLEGELALYYVETLGEEAFKGCAGITGVTLGSVLTSLEREAFADCSALKNFVIPGSVSAIGQSALKGCVCLRTVNIPAAADTIGAQAFAGNTALEKVYFYGDVPSNWAEDSFTGCGQALTLYYRSARTDWEQFGGVWNELPLVAQEKFYEGKKDHYSFLNSSGSFGYPYDYRIGRRRYVDVLDSIIMGSYYYATSDRWGGSCYGMAISTLDFYENQNLNPADYDALAENLYDLAAPYDKNAKLTALIEEYQVSQFHPIVSGYQGIIYKNKGKYKEIVQKIEEFERSGGLTVDHMAEPIALLIYSATRQHAVIPVSIDQAENGNFLVQVYEPNKPSELQTLTIYKDFDGIYYDGYTEASYLDYSVIAQIMSGVQTYEKDRKSVV